MLENSTKANSSMPSQENSIVSPLKKIHLKLTAGSSEGIVDLTPTPLYYQFILGIGTDGFTHLECVLNGKTVGEVINFLISTSELQSFLDPVPSNGFIIPIDQSHIFLSISIEQVENAENREIVKAMAKKNEDGCSCGCGC